MSAYDFRFSRLHRMAGLPFGVMPSTTRVELDGDVLTARFGPWTVRTPIDNVESVEKTGGFSVVKTAGPAHVSVADRGLTFATNTDRALCLRFRQAVRGIDPVGAIKHPGLTVTVEDVDGLEAELTAHGVRSEG